MQHLIRILFTPHYELNPVNLLKHEGSWTIHLLICLYCHSVDVFLLLGEFQNHYFVWFDFQDFISLHLVDKEFVFRFVADNYARFQQNLFACYFQFFVDNHLLCFNQNKLALILVGKFGALLVDQLHPITELLSVESHLKTANVASRDDVVVLKVLQSGNFENRVLNWGDSLTGSESHRLHQLVLFLRTLRILNVPGVKNRSLNERGDNKRLGVNEQGLSRSAVKTLQMHQIKLLPIEIYDWDSFDQILPFIRRVHVEKTGNLKSRNFHLALKRVARRTVANSHRLLRHQHQLLCYFVLVMEILMQHYREWQPILHFYLWFHNIVSLPSFKQIYQV